MFRVGDGGGVRRELLQTLGVIREDNWTRVAPDSVVRSALGTVSEGERLI